MPIVCQTCDSDVSPTWWKCCPKHTTERGRDVVCQNCANICMRKDDLQPSSLVPEEVRFIVDPMVEFANIKSKTFICTVCGLVENVKQGSPEHIKETVFGVVCNNCVQSFEEWLATKKDVSASNE